MATLPLFVGNAITGITNASAIPLPTSLQNSFPPGTIACQQITTEELHINGCDLTKTMSNIECLIPPPKLKLNNFVVLSLYHQWQQAIEAVKNLKEQLEMANTLANE